MPDPNIVYLIRIVLTAVASLAWALCLLTAASRYRAFRQRADLWWALAFVCLIGVGLLRSYESWLIRGAYLAAEEPGAVTRGVEFLTTILAPMEFAVDAAFLLASVLAIRGYMRRPDAFDV